MRKITISCPFCETNVEVLFSESTVGSKIQRNSTSKKRVTIFIPEKYHALENCSKCGKTKEEIQKALDGKAPIRIKSKEEIRKQLEELGLLGRYENGNQ